MNETLKFKFLETWVLNFCHLNIILDSSTEKMSRNFYSQLKKIVTFSVLLQKGFA